MTLDKEDIATASEMAQTLQKSKNSELIVIGNLLSYLLAERVEPQRTWVGLTDEDICNLEGFYDCMTKEEFFDAIRGVEAKLKEKNNG